MSVKSDSVSDSKECQLENSEKVTVNSISNNQTLTTDTDTSVHTDTVYVTASVLLEYLCKTYGQHIPLLTVCLSVWQAPCYPLTSVMTINLQGIAHRVPATF